MLISVDTETYEKNNEGYYIPTLNSQKMVLGCVTDEQLRTETYFDAEELWEDINALGSWLKKQKKKLYVYAHNHEYDWYAYAKNHLMDEELQYIRFNPFLARKDNIYFLDTMSYYNMSLAAVGTIIGEEKGIMPQKITDIKELIPYCTQDTRIVMKAIQKIQQTTAQLGFKQRKYLTAGQTAMSSFLTWCKKHDTTQAIMQKRRNDQGRYIHSVVRSMHGNKIRQAFRGGRNEAYQQGSFENVTNIDINSLYPYIMTTMNFPDLQKEIYLRDPNVFTEEELCTYEGVMRCTLDIPTTNLGYLPVTYQGDQHYKKSGTITGTWTIKEIRRAINEGYNLTEKEWAILYPQSKENPLKAYMKKMYQLRRESSGDYQYVIKLLMNNLYGKFAQINQERDYKKVTREESKEWFTQGWEMIGNYENYYIINKKGKKQYPQFFNPMISTQITAYARDYFYNALHKIPTEDLLYCDTDGILFQGNHKKKFSISKEMGDWKIVHENEPAVIFGEKRYSIGNVVKISGIHKAEQPRILDKETIVTTKKIIGFLEGIRNNQINAIGTFREEKKVIEKGSKADIPLPEHIIETWEER